MTQVPIEYEFYLHLFSLCKFGFEEETPYCFGLQPVLGNIT